jgi:hypothetical protein
MSQIEDVSSALLELDSAVVVPLSQARLKNGIALKRCKFGEV